MKAMILSDLIAMRSFFATMIGVTVFISIIMALATGTLLTAMGCIAAMMPFLYMFSISSYDEQNGWERFRLTLPISKHQVAYGRYASILIVTVCTLVASVVIAVLIGLICEALSTELAMIDDLKISNVDILSLLGTGIFAQIIIIVAIAISLPIIMRFGMTKGSRFLPVVLVLAISAFVAYFGESLDIADIAVIFGNPIASIAWMLATFAAIAAVLYVISALISARLYEHHSL